MTPPPADDSVMRMAEWLPRLIAVAVVAVLVLSVVASTRSCQEVAEPTAQRGAASVEKPQARGGSRPLGNRPDGTGTGPVGGFGSGGENDARGSGAGSGGMDEPVGGERRSAGVANVAGAVNPAPGSRGLDANPAAAARALVDEPIRQATLAAAEVEAQAAAVEQGRRAEMLNAAATASGTPPAFAALRDAAGEDSASDEPATVENVDFDVDLGAYFPPNAQLGFANRGGFRPEEGTVMFWVQPVDWDGEMNNSFSFFLLRDPKSLHHNFSILKNEQRLRFQVINENGVEVVVFWRIDDWQRGEWHHIAATWSSSLLSLFVDGVLVGEQTAQGMPAVSPDAPAWWGSSRGTNGAGAILADARIFDHALSDQDIAAEAQRVPR